MAWAFVQARETLEARRIKREHFIEQYFAARDVVNNLKTQFGSNIQVNLLLKNNDNTNRVYKANIDQIDNHVQEKYTSADLERTLINTI